MSCMRCETPRSPIQNSWALSALQMARALLTLYFTLFHPFIGFALSPMNDRSLPLPENTDAIDSFKTAVRKERNGQIFFG